MSNTVFILAATCLIVSVGSIFGSLTDNKQNARLDEIERTLMVRVP